MVLLLFFLFRTRAFQCFWIQDKGRVVHRDIQRFADSRLSFRCKAGYSILLHNSGLTRSTLIPNLALCEMLNDIGSTFSFPVKDESILCFYDTIA